MPSNLLNPFDLESSPLEVAPESGLEDYEELDDDQFLADADTLERLTVGGLRVSSVVRAAGFDSGPAVAAQKLSKQGKYDQALKEIQKLQLIARRGRGLKTAIINILDDASYENADLAYVQATAGSRAAGFEELIPEPAYMPKALTKLIMTELKKAKLKGVSLVKDSAATPPRGGWEYGILIQLYLTPDPDRVPQHSQGRHECTIKINGAETRANGIATLEFPDGADHVLASKGGNDPVAVAKMLASEIVQHFLAARDD
jgi:hypothetical protein